MDSNTTDLLNEFKVSLRAIEDGQLGIVFEAVQNIVENERANRVRDIETQWARLPNLDKSFKR